MLQKDIQMVIDTDCSDNAEDKDKNGISDVMEIPPQELLQRKFYLFFKVLKSNSLPFYDNIVTARDSLKLAVRAIKLYF